MKFWDRGKADPIESKNKSRKYFLLVRIKSYRFKKKKKKRFASEESIELAWRVPTGATPPRQFNYVQAFPTTHHRGDKSRTLALGDRGDGPRPRLQTTAQRTPAAAPQKISHGGRKPDFSTSSIGQGPLKTERSTPKDGGKSIAASASVSRARRLKASSAYPREAETDKTASLPAPPKKKQRLAAAGTRRCAPSRSSAFCSVRVSRVRCVRCFALQMS